MTFTAANLTLIFGAKRPRVWAYWTNDLLNAVTASGYFNSAYAGFTLGDLILVAGDLDGTPFTTQLTISSATGAATVTTTDLASATITFAQRHDRGVRILVLGTSETQYFVVARACTITKVLGVSNVNGAGSGGTSTITITVPTTGAIATLPFLQDYVAGTAIEDTTITTHSLAAGAVVTVATDGTGTHTGVADVTLEITPS